MVAELLLIMQKLKKRPTSSNICADMFHAPLHTQQLHRGGRTALNEAEAEKKTDIVEYLRGSVVYSQKEVEPLKTFSIDSARAASI